MEWIKQNYKTAFIIAMICLAIIILFVAKRCATISQYHSDTSIAVSQERISELERKIDEKDTQIAISKQKEDSLFSVVRMQEFDLIKFHNNIITITKKYDSERNKVKELSGVESVGLFLDNTEQPEFPVIQYEDSTQYVIPITSIEYANVAFVDLQEQLSVNSVLRDESNVKSVQIKTLNSIIDEKENQIVVLTEVNKYTNDVIKEKDSQIQSEHNKYNKQLVKTITTGAIGGILLICSLIF